MEINAQSEPDTILFKGWDLHQNLNQHTQRITERQNQKAQRGVYRSQKRVCNKGSRSYEVIKNRCCHRPKITTLRIEHSGKNSREAVQDYLNGKKPEEIDGKLRVKFNISREGLCIDNLSCKNNA